MIFSAVYLLVVLTVLTASLLYFDRDELISAVDDIALTVSDMLGEFIPAFAGSHPDGKAPLSSPVKRVYVPPRPAAQELEVEARLITEEPEMGSAAESPSSEPPSADTYSFDEEFYPFYHMLAPEQQQAYRLIYEHAQRCEPEITLDEPLADSELADAMTAFYSDHPEFFWLDTRYGYGYLEQGVALSVTLFFNDTAKNLEYCRRRFEEAVDAVVEAASTLAGDYQKEKYVHDYLIYNVEYDERAAFHQSAYSALVNGKSVCAGYSRAFQLIMQRLGIPCYYCSGEADGVSHAWNIVRIDGEFYNADLSWNDPVNAPEGYYCSDYLNVSDLFISAEHSREGMSLYLPQCTLNGPYSAAAGE